MFLDKLFSSDPISDLRNPAMWLVNSFGGGRTSSGVTVNTSNALTVSTYFACLRNLSEDVGTLPIFIYEEREGGRGQDKARKHPLYPILTLTTNANMTSTVYRQAMVWALCGWGNAYSEIVRNRRGVVTALNFIHPSRVTVERRDGIITYKVSGDINGTMVTTELTTDEMLHVKGPSEDGIIGLTMIQLMAQSLGVAISEQEYNGELFANGAVLSGVLTHPKTLKSDAQDRLRDSWGKFTGSGNRHKPLILEEEMTWTPMGVPPRDAQFIESRNFTVNELARWFRMPPHKLMHLEDATYSNIESQDRQYVTDTLMPWLIRIEEEMDVKLLSEGERARGLYIEHNAEGRLRGDTVARAAFYRTLFNMGSISPNEIRDKENLNPIDLPEGDQYYLQINLAPIDQLDQQSNDDPFGGDEPDDDPDEPDDPTPPADDDDDDDANSAMDVLVSDAVMRVCRRASKVKNRGEGFLESQGAYLESAIKPILIAFSKRHCAALPLSESVYDDPQALHTYIMENLHND